MRIIWLILFSLSIISCDKKTGENKITGTSLSEIEKDILKVNRYIVKRNRDHVAGFLKRTGWDMKETGSGLYIMIEKPGNGPLPDSGQTVVLDYTLKLIDGTTISSSERSGRLNFIAGKGVVVNGLEESVFFMNEGSRARIILLPHLAYGNFGDANIGIPPDAILIYFLEMKKII